MRRSTDSDIIECTFDSSHLSDIGLVEDFSSGGNVYIDTLRTQDAIGSTIDFTQGTTTIQPIICESGTAITKGGLLAAKFVKATNHRMSVSASTSLFNFIHDGTACTISIVNETTAEAAEKSLLHQLNPGFRITRHSGRCFNMVVESSVAHNINVADSVQRDAYQTLSVFIDADASPVASRWAGWSNNAPINITNGSSGAASPSNASSNLFLGSHPFGFGGFDGTIQEVIIWPTDERASRATWEADQAAAYGITLT